MDAVLSAMFGAILSRYIHSSVWSKQSEFQIALNMGFIFYFGYVKGITNEVPDL